MSSSRASAVGYASGISQALSMRFSATTTGNGNGANSHSYKFYTYLANNLAFHPSVWDSQTCATTKQALSLLVLASHFELVSRSPACSLLCGYSSIGRNVFMLVGGEAREFVTVEEHADAMKQLSELRRLSGECRLACHLSSYL